MIGYQFSGDFDESAVEKLLIDAARKGVIHHLFDTGRGRMVWFNGWPGKELRALRDRVLAAMR